MDVGIERLRIEEVVVDAPVDDVHRLKPVDGVGKDAVVLDHEIAALDQRHAHLARQKHVLEVGGIVDAGRQQHDTRIVDAGRRHLAQLAQQALAVVGDRANFEPLHQIGKGALHQMAVLDDIGNAGRAAAVVLEHQEFAFAIAHDVGAVDVDIGAAREIQSDHLLAISRGWPAPARPAPRHP